MKLMMAMMTVGLVFLGGITTIRAETFATSEAARQDSNEANSAISFPSGLHPVDMAPSSSAAKGIVENGRDRIDENNIRQKISSDRVDLVIKRSRDGIKITFAPQSDRGVNRNHFNCVKSGSGDFDESLKIGSFAEDSVEPKSVKSVKKRDPAASGKFGLTKRDGLSNMKLSDFPGLSSLMLATLDLIGVVIGCYRQRRSFVV